MIENQGKFRERFPTSEIAEILVKKGVVGISEGFPVQDPDELFQLLLTLTDQHRISRMPIIGIQEPGSKDLKEEKRVQTFILFKTGRSEHAELMRQLEAWGYKEQDVIFTTSIEELAFDKEPNTHYLEFVTSEGVEVRVRVGNGSDKLRKPLGSLDHVRQLFPAQKIRVI